MRTVEVPVGPFPYKVHIGEGLAGSLGELPDVASLLKGRGVALVSDQNVHRLHGEAMERGLALAGAVIKVSYAFAPGEENKNFASLCGIWNALVDGGVERKDLIVAFGGGVVGDVAGFAAATYLRGVDFLQVPTTLLAMVDSSVGGKTGIDHPRGKNLIGAFHQPRAVVADTDFLETLPRREALSGLAEAIKAGILADADLFALLEKRGPGILYDQDALLEAVAKSVKVKAHIVAEDEREGGVRALLNFGHTVGHAVEAALGFSGLTHGEAVALGMGFATRLAAKSGMIERGGAGRILALLENWGYPARAEGLRWEEIKKGFAFDKKKESGETRWVLPLDIGRAQWGKVVDTVTVDLLLAEMQGAK